VNEIQPGYRQAKPNIYQVKVEGKLDESWSDWFHGMAFAFERDITTLTGPVIDQAALQGILTRIWNLNLTLISVNRLEMKDTI
jgi:hypothetical protein